MYLLGIDIGTSSTKSAIFDTDSQNRIQKSGGMQRCVL